MQVKLGEEVIHDWTEGVTSERADPLHHQHYYQPADGHEVLQGQGQCIKEWSISALKAVEKMKDHLYIRKREFLLFLDHISVAQCKAEVSAVPVL